MQGRIWFEGNPWPNGHAIISANMHIFLVDGEDKKSPFDAGAYLNLTIKTDNYDSENTDEDRDRIEAQYKAEKAGKTISDWESFGVWKNYSKPCGELVFLECNPEGQWLFMEIASGVNMTRPLAEFFNSF